MKSKCGNCCAQESGSRSLQNQLEKGGNAMGWELDDSRPIWPQLKEQLTRSIIAGKYPMGGNFPTVRELAEEAGVNRNTMQRALSELESEGLVITNRTVGRTVTTDERLIAQMKETIAREIIDRFIEEMEVIGYHIEDVIEIIQQKGECL